MSQLILRLGGWIFDVGVDELVQVDDADTIRRSNRSPFLVRLGFAAWVDHADELIDDPLSFDGAQLDPVAGPLTTAHADILQTTLVVLRRQETVWLLNGLDASRHLVAITDARGRRLNARTRQSPSLVGLAFAAAVADRDVLSNPTDAGCVEL